MASADAGLEKESPWGLLGLCSKGHPPLWPGVSEHTAYYAFFSLLGPLPTLGQRSKARGHESDETSSVDGGYPSVSYHPLSRAHSQSLCRGDTMAFSELQKKLPVKQTWPGTR